MMHYMGPGPILQVTVRSPIAVPMDRDLQVYDGAMTPDRKAAFHRMVCDLARQPTGNQTSSLNEISVGLVSGPTVGTLGLGSGGCIVVAVTDKPSRTADLVAEELGHALSRPHAGCNVHPPVEGAPCEPTFQQFPCARRHLHARLRHVHATRHRSGQPARRTTRA